MGRAEIGWIILQSASFCLSYWTVELSLTLKTNSVALHFVVLILLLCYPVQMSITYIFCSSKRNILSFTLQRLTVWNAKGSLLLYPKTFYVILFITIHHKSYTSCKVHMQIQMTSHITLSTDIWSKAFI